MRPEEPVSFRRQKELHDLVEQAPEVMPLVGAPRSVMLGREVLCGKGTADLIAVQVATARPVIIGNQAGLKHGSAPGIYTGLGLRRPLWGGSTRRSYARLPTLMDVNHPFGVQGSHF